MLLILQRKNFVICVLQTIRLEVSLGKRYRYQLRAHRFKTFLSRGYLRAH